MVCCSNIFVRKLNSIRPYGGVPTKCKCSLWNFKWDQVDLLGCYISRISEPKTVPLETTHADQRTARTHK